MTTIPRTMSAVLLKGHGGFDQLEYRDDVPVPRPKPRFGHAAEAAVGPYVLLGCFHPSQQNTFTGKLTRQMTDEVFIRARALV